VNGSVQIAVIETPGLRGR